MNSFYDFLYYTYPDILTVLGTLGNFFSFLVFSRKRFEKMRINLAFKAMSVLNTIMLLQFVVNIYTSLYYFSLIDTILCKSLQYLASFLPTASAWIFVYASLLRFITIRRTAKIKLLEKLLV